MLSQKGGAGKTTLSCAISALAEQAGHRTVLLDIDPKGAPATGTTCARTPASNTPMSSPPTPTASNRLLNRMEPLGVTLCVIDTAPHSGGDAYTVASLADHILIPVQPSAPDLRAIHQTIQIAESAGKPASVVINRALVNHPTIAERATRSWPLPARRSARSPCISASLTATPSTQGRCAAETEPGTTAATELNELYAWLVSTRAIPQAQTREIA